jgi:hypothetical protein
MEDIESHRGGFGDLAATALNRDKLVLGERHKWQAAAPLSPTRIGRVRDNVALTVMTPRDDVAHHRNGRLDADRHPRLS